LRVVYRYRRQVEVAFDANSTPTRSKQHRVEPFGRARLHVRRDVRVGVQGLRDVRVTQHLLHHLGVFTVLQHEGRRGVSECVEGHLGQVATSAQRREVPPHLGVVCSSQGPQGIPQVGQRHEDEPSLEGPEGATVDASETSQEISAACPGEALYPISDAPTATRTSTEPVLGSGVLEGECGYGPSYGRGDVGNPLM
jgi:hypothetical protein